MGQRAAEPPNRPATVGSDPHRACLLEAANLAPRPAHAAPPSELPCLRLRPAQLPAPELASEMSGPARGFAYVQILARGGKRRRNQIQEKESGSDGWDGGKKESGSK
ncbi:hypothetical protein PR202_ga02796 [Eleusine coracana subsp. coracana]|uniref:Uncharacterized protein n=1 Tax=Eleusine coracana subsp. coracana TaxID=191504 RepID=A0AAV5BKF8_ELECO|nr:hypothetical protein PR202_ga02796 [Eleusine coracana subsp. coracana]